MGRVALVRGLVCVLLGWSDRCAMPSMRLQPVFRMLLRVESREATARLRQAIRSPELAGLVESAAQCFDFKIEAPQRRVWSPHLSVQLSDLADDAPGAAPRTELFGRFSPRPEVWTLVMFCYFAAAF